MTLAFRIRLSLARMGARAALVWERTAGVVFPAFLFPAFYLALALFGLWERLGDPWRLGALMLTFVLTLRAVWRGAALFSWPKRADVDRRLEEDSALTGQPLALLDDAPVMQERAARTLWAEGQNRARFAVRHVRVRRPKAALAARDMYGLRAAAMLVLFAGFVLAGPQSGQRLRYAIDIGYHGGAGPVGTLEAWITPPDYTGLPPVFLSKETHGPIKALRGSVFHGRINGMSRTPVLRLYSGQKRRTVKAVRIAPGSFEISAPLDGDSVLAIKNRENAQWTIVSQNDTPPRIVFTKPPAADKTDALAFSYAASDDFGIAEAALVIKAAGETQKNDKIALEINAPDTRTIKDKPRLDLTRHRWAGLPVTGWLEARDALGQVAQSRPVRFTMPQKSFVNPLARAVAEQRFLIIRAQTPWQAAPPRPPKSAGKIAAPSFYIDDPARRLERAPKPVRRAAALIRASLRAPDLYFTDIVPYLGLRHAAETLRLARSKADLAGLDGELWDIANWVEGGDLENARAAMKAAERDLRRALTRGADADELNRLTDVYKRAVQRFLTALAEDALRKGKTAQNQGGGNANMDANALEDMLNALAELAKTGGGNDARTLLQALSQLLKNLQMNIAHDGRGQGNGDNEMTKALRDALEKLGELTAAQRELLDEAFRAHEGENAAPPKNAAPAQQGLAKKLGDLRKDNNAAGQSEALKRAQEDMERAARGLRNGLDADDLNAAKDALAELRAGTEKLAQELFDQKQKGAGQGKDTDPLGRQNANGGLATDGPNLPLSTRIQRAREILKLLRERAAEQGRDPADLDYLERLLERF